VASGFRNSSGTDLDSIFDQTAPGAQTTGYRLSTGADIGARYTPLSAGTAAAATGYKIASGADLNTLFAALGTTGYSGTLTAATSGTAPNQTSGYISGFLGSISSTIFRGKTITALDSTYSISPGTGFNISGFSADPGKAFFTTLTVQGTPLTSASSTYSYSGGVASWGWGSVVISASGSYTVAIS
jgi:methylmalonyl-CoA mutase N-terminal domain/subunit